MVVAMANLPPGLNLHEIFSGIPQVFSRKSICVKSSRFIVALSFLAYLNSSAGVSFDENMISSPEKPIFSDIISSVSDEQSVLQPSSLRILRIVGFGVALTAKYSLKPLFHENAL